MPFVPLADAETLALGFIQATFPSLRRCTELPANLETVVPLVQVVRFGGQSDTLTLDAANIDYDYFDGAHDNLSARVNARAGAAQIRTALLYHAQGFALNGAAIQSVSEVSAPRWVPYDNGAVRRFTGAVRITIHSIPN